MPALIEGSEVTVLCQICGTPINPTGNFGGRVCGNECYNELEWREVLCITQGKIGTRRGFARYKMRKEQQK